MKRSGKEGDDGREKQGDVHAIPVKPSSMIQSTSSALVTFSTGNAKIGRRVVVTTT